MKVGKQVIVLNLPEQVMLAEIAVVEYYPA